ncbi:uncharacterized protein N0V89_012114 [Didymosphaeria variabile]|uniref:DUF7924 domain-containing protein n=1 Tax=Didymosphaeria variabile TaxID=1932322 RepID=A0A9W8X8J5_9PLEO|nr:uncharacterized protein N0V89_012114 [Didymosphaeria variabile]KAJ4344374.1 hypothetical protein N0V89_012114 [Didymosphaeria variabile]
MLKKLASSGDSLKTPLGSMQQSHEFASTPTEEPVAVPNSTPKTSALPMNASHGSQIDTSASPTNNIVAPDTPPTEPPAATPIIWGCSLPLTEATVQKFSGDSSCATLQESSIVTPATSHTGRQDDTSRASAGSDIITKAIDEVTKLRAHNVQPDTKRALPKDIADFISGVLQRPLEGERSPNAKEVVTISQDTAFSDEDIFLFNIAPWLVIPFHQPGPMLASVGKTRLSTDWLPTASEEIVKGLGALSEARPDTALGYAKKGIVDPSTKTAFTSHEEFVYLSRFDICEELLMPFLTAQYKPANGESFTIAQFEGARDGACIVNYLYEFYDAAKRDAPTTLETCHFSITVDPWQAMLWVHWSEAEQDTRAYYSKLVMTCSNRSVSQVQEFRVYIKNLINWACEDRLRSIKEALPDFHANRGPPTKRQKKGTTS